MSTSPTQTAETQTAEAETAETEASSAGQSTTTQAGLFDTTYEYSTEGNLPEDIQRDFEIPASASLFTLTLPVDWLLEEIKPAWKDAAELIKECSDQPAWEGSINSLHLERVLRHIPSSINEMKIAVTEDGWYASVVDSANVCMFEYWLHKDDFSQYNLSDEGVLGINISHLKKTFKSDSKGQDIDISFNDDRTYTVDDGTPVTASLIDPDSVRQSPDLPDLHLPCSIELPGEEVKTLIRRLGEFGDHFRVTSDEANQDVVFETESHDTDFGKKYAGKEDLQVYNPLKPDEHPFNLDVPESGSSLVSGDYLGGFIQSLRNKDLSEAYTVIFGHEFPIMIEMGLCGGSFARFMLAPRIEA